MGRKTGSKNKPKINVEVLADNTESKNISPDNGIKQELSTSTPIKRGRGRPRKVKLNDDELVIKKDNHSLAILFGNVKDLKQEIRKLRKLKLQCRAGSKERIELHRKIKDLKQQLKTIKENQQSFPECNDSSKVLLIEEIYCLDPLIKTLLMDLNQYTIEQLKKHIECVKRKKGLK
jgi:hypothetical protein